MSPPTSTCTQIHVQVLARDRCAAAGARATLCLSGARRAQAIRREHLLQRRWSRRWHGRSTSRPSDAGFCIFAICIRVGSGCVRTPRSLCIYAFCLLPSSNIPTSSGAAAPTPPPPPPLQSLPPPPPPPPPAAGDGARSHGGGAERTCQGRRLSPVPKVIYPSPAAPRKKTETEESGDGGGMEGKEEGEDEEATHNPTSHGPRVHRRRSPPPLHFSPPLSTAVPLPLAPPFATSGGSCRDRAAAESPEASHAKKRRSRSGSSGRQQISSRRPSSGASGSNHMKVAWCDTVAAWHWEGCMRN